MTRVAIYVRVSKEQQSYTRQVKELTAYSKSRGYKVAKVIAEKISGARNNKDRGGIQELVEMVRQQEVSKVLVSEVSRLGRKTSEVLQVLEELTEQGVSVYVQNFNMETLNPDGSRNPIAQFLFTILAEFARMERESLIQRINSGLAEAKRKGIRLGRKPGSVVPPAKSLAKYKDVVQLLQEGKTIREAAAICKVGTATVLKVKKTMYSINSN
ncbi:DNA invertase Pin-like site-specific DNA recombinase [Pontibacter ummariensis]|uniref:Site-specific DNA recombinase n=1 Tax=Pontibacter ummariensis TaxID=1610492 RepID=A0A239HND9_9BACT|nr:recombinase family protein [Pontibacter ummariensis]PRY10302.1 DNA invertase Pin-like site-specific DNA recombinase [Pontibacter ummariensis]SNS81764.1 Site-specific DNA recombinase [Pontibacter ummariensis]